MSEKSTVYKFTYFPDFLFQKRAALFQWVSLCGLTGLFDISSPEHLDTWLTDYFCAMSQYAWSKVNQVIKSVPNCPSASEIMVMYSNFEHEYSQTYGIPSLDIEDESVLSYRAKKSFEYWLPKKAG